MYIEIFVAKLSSRVCCLRCRAARCPPVPPPTVPVDEIPPKYKPGDLPPCVPVDVVRSSRLVIGMIPGII